MTRLTGMTAVFALLVAGPAAALDNTQNLVCDFTQAAQCDTAASCESVKLEEIGLPPVFLVDFEAKTLTSENGDRSSPIAAVEVGETSLLVQGHQNGRVWGLALDRTSGHASAAAASVDGAFILAGACTPR